MTCPIPPTSSIPARLLPVAMMLAALVLVGCAKANLDVTQRADMSLPRPDHLVVHDFVVSSSDVKLDRGISAKAARDLKGRTPTQEELAVGRAVATALSKELTAELNKRGITAYRAGTAPSMTRTSGAIVGQFVSIDQGDRTQRVWLGFGLGGSKLDTRVLLYQGGEVVSRGIVTTSASLKPGMLVSLGAGAATGGIGTAAALGAGGATLSESVLATVEADAKRAARAIADRIEQGYKERGWL